MGLLDDDFILKPIDNENRNNESKNQNTENKKSILDDEFEIKDDSLLPNEEDLLIKELEKKCKQLNFDYWNALYKIKSIAVKKRITSNDIVFLKKLEIIDYRSILNENTRLSFGDELIDSMFIKSFSFSFDWTALFFYSVKFEDWDLILNKYRTVFLEIGREISFMFKFINALKKNLALMYIDYSKLNNNKYITNLYDFETFWFEYEKEENLIIKKKQYIDLISFYEMSHISEEFGDYEKNYLDFIQKCKKAVEQIDYQIIFDQQNEVIVEEMNNENKKNKEFTTKRQVLAIYYLLNEFDEKMKFVDRTIKARFVEFLTGKSYDSIYAKLSEPHKGLDNSNNKNVLNDMKYVKDHFEKLGLKDIAEKISKDMRI